MPQGPSPATLRAYEPSLRDRAASKLQELLGGGRTAQHFTERLLGSNGLGGSGGALDFTPLAAPFWGDEAGRKVAQGHPVAGVSDLLLAAVPLPAVKAGAKPIVNAVANRAAPIVRKSVAEPIRAYHGSPHTFDQFSLDHIGTGEGRQVFGPGLYFAEKEEVAAPFRRPAREVDNEINTQLSDLSRQLDGERAYRFGPEVTERGRQLRAQYDDLLDRRAANRGSMYEVDIDAHPDELLHWDRALADHPEPVQDALLAIRFKGDADQIAAAKRSPDFMGRSVGANMTDLHLAGIEPRSVADGLAAAGVPGLRYRDQGRAFGSSNYVMFDPSRVDIARRYGILAALGLGGYGAANQPPEAAP